MLNYEGAAVYVGEKEATGTYRRMGALFGDDAISSGAVLRYARLSHAPSSSPSFLGSGFRVKLSA